MELLDYDPLTGERVTLDWHDDKLVVGYEQDMQPVLDANERAVVEADHKAQIKKGWVKYAAGITNTVIVKWRQEHGVDFFNPDHWPRVMALLNSRDYRRLKTTTINHDR